MNCEHVSSCSGSLCVCGSRCMMKLLLLLSACFGVGLSYDTDEQEYGSTYRISLHRKAHTIEFSPKYTSRGILLWKRNDPQWRGDDRRKVVGYYFVISNVTQKDSGRYTQREESRLVVSRSNLDVVASIDHYFREPGESLKIISNVEPSSCNIYFFPSGGTSYEIVSDGWLQQSYSDCDGFQHLKPCGILNEYLQSSCRGRYEIRDSAGNTAVVVELDMDTNLSPLSYIGIGVGFVVSLICSCCMRLFCCRKSSSDKESSQAAAEDNENEPAVRYHEYDREPSGQRQNQHHEPSGTQYPAQPSYTPAAVPLIHNPPPERMPPAYSEIGVSSEPADAPTIPLYSEFEPRFEVKGMNLNADAPLSSDSPHCSVYTSDKLNFL